MLPVLDTPRAHSATGGAVGPFEPGHAIRIDRETGFGGVQNFGQVRQMIDARGFSITTVGRRVPELSSAPILVALRYDSDLAEELL